MSAEGYYIGLMSGTSMDGIDAVLVEIGQQQVSLLHSISYPWPSALKTRLITQASQETCTLHEYGELDHLCAQEFAQATLALLESAGVPAHTVQAIGSHGQTLYHHPHPPTAFTLQIGDPNIIAETTGIRVVADLRRRDMAAGGQGAPLVPAFHQAVFHSPHKNRVILNIGGIANITILPATGNLVTGFDTGPGNCLMDRWCQKHLERPYDKDGSWASQGEIDSRLMQTLLEDAYFHMPPPKSTGTEYFNLEWLEHRLQEHPDIDDRDVQASLLALTASTITRAIQDWAADAEEILVCGGGVHNHALISTLSRMLSPQAVASTDSIDHGIHPDWVEAAAFAWLAKQTLDGAPGNLPSVTGARHPVILGGIYPPTDIPQR
ncbi:anhydro-N-acetylmuramic acid kinase [Thiolapillus brandeum]|uniref:Anhydro-N-acetylmuramic acid kinase n=1 Tax=Thiolapillus brandeum TaxID=1076588 RepID=A0A7U6GKX7_9GAMM|nr:anhydro-N-acetylmuramic acid kinase [Thiolapillus brandeum]BAO45568.1 anhydro-N-acetylmuramic acid kinase [Thiolapillus brandeum]